MIHFDEYSQVWRKILPTTGSNAKLAETDMGAVYLEKGKEYNLTFYVIDAIGSKAQVDIAVTVQGDETSSTEETSSKQETTTPEETTPEQDTTPEETTPEETTPEETTTTAPSESESSTPEESTTPTEGATSEDGENS